MPAPPNMRRTETGPKTQKSSWMSSGLTAGLMRVGAAACRRLELDRLATAARGSLVRVVEHELRGELVGLVIHLGADQEQDRLRVDQHAHALVLDHLVGGADLVGIFHRIGHAGAAAV